MNTYVHAITAVLDVGQKWTTLIPSMQIIVFGYCNRVSIQLVHFCPAPGRFNLLIRPDPNGLGAILVGGV